jgi:hypothetical protein
LGCAPVSWCFYRDRISRNRKKSPSRLLPVGGGGASSRKPVVKRTHDCVATMEHTFVRGARRRREARVCEGSGVVLTNTLVTRICLRPVSDGQLVPGFIRVCERA